MPAQQQAANNQANDNALDFLWIIVMIVAAAVLIWVFGKKYIIQGLFFVKTYELLAVQYVLTGWKNFVNFTHLPLPTPNMRIIDEWKTYVQTSSDNVPVESLLNVCTGVGKYLSIPVAAILSILGLIIYRSNLASKFKRIFNMQRLKVLDQREWPQITPVLKLDLVGTDLNEGPWAMALTPMEFCKRYNLLKIEKENNKTQATLLSGAAHRVFSLQLGPIWNEKRLPIHVKALFAIFAARANRDRDNADKLLLQIAASAADTGKLNFTGSEELFTKHCSSKLAQRVVQRHGYLLTIMPSMLELARTDGVLASAEFLWLKPVDRKLWYILNSVGRQTAIPEVAGIFAHWNAEKTIQRPLQVPMVEEAVKAMEVALKEIIFEEES